MGVKTRNRTRTATQDGPDVYGVEVSTSSTRPEPLVDVGTDEEQVIRRLTNLATTGDFGFDDSRDWAELLPTIPTLIGALHTLPEVLRGRTPEERERLAELFAAKFEEQLGEHSDNLIARVLEPNQGMTNAYGLLIQERRLKDQADALIHQNGQLVAERGSAYRASEEWNGRFRQAEQLRDQRRELLVKLNFNPDFSPTVKKTRSALRDFDAANSELRGSVLGYIGGDASSSWESTRSAAQSWLASFEEINRQVRAPNPKRAEEKNTDAPEEEDTYPED